MSYKKFSRNHGKTHRVKKYAYTNPDHNYRGETGRCSSIITFAGVSVFRPVRYGERHDNPAKRELRRVRRILNMAIRTIDELT